MNRITDNDEGRKYFTFYRSFFEAIEKCEEADQLALFRAIAEFGLNGVEPNFGNPMLDLVWTLIRPNLDASWSKYVNGKKGGCPLGTRKPTMVGNKNASKQNQNETETKPNQKQNKSNKGIRNKEKGIYNIETNVSLSESSDADSTSDLDFDAFLKCWNDAAGDSNLKKLNYWTDKRKNHLQARYKDCLRATDGRTKFAKKMLFDAIKNAKTSVWLNGEGLRFANFDWIFTHPNNFAKVLDGHYNS